MDDIRFRPRDYLAIIVVLCCFTALFLGFDGEVKALLGMVLGYYFGLYTKAPKEPKNGKSSSTQHPA